MMSQDQPPRTAIWLLNLFTTGEEGESIQGDLLEEFFHLASKSGAVAARRWYWRQTIKTIAHLIGIGILAAPWTTAVVIIGGFFLNRFVSGLPERALFAVLERYSVFDRHFNTYLFFASYGPAAGHVIASFFAGCLVAWVSKGREMVATIGLVLVYCAMTFAALFVWMAVGRAPVLWMLAWNLAAWFATILSGAIVRTLRSDAAMHRSHA